LEIITAVVLPSLTAACPVRQAGDTLIASPSSTEQTSALLRAAAEHDLTVVARGAGTGWVRPHADLVVDTRAMDEVVEHVAGDLVVTVQAGATAGRLAEVLGSAGQRLALDVPPDVTIGGMLATGMAGPLRFRYGSPRDLLIGITVVRADGVVAHSGGKVVKNVAGYDLGKLFTGSHGTLGLITEATFRLHPIPQFVAVLTWGVQTNHPDPPPATRPAALSPSREALRTSRPPGREGPAAPPRPGDPRSSLTLAAAPPWDAVASLVTAAANSPLVPSAVELDISDGIATVGVLLEGTTSGVAERVHGMTELLGAAEVSDTPPAWWGRLPSPAGPVVRVTFWLRSLADVLDVIASSGIRCTVRGSAGAGMLYICADDDVDVGGLVSALRSVVLDRGSVVVLTEPPGSGSKLMQAVRDQFDPGHRMGGRVLCRTTTRCGALRRTACTAGSACRPAPRTSCGARRWTPRAGEFTWSTRSLTAPR
jgi:glycolate oxidase FAD binding subunit